MDDLSGMNRKLAHQVFYGKIFRVVRPIYIGTIVFGHGSANEQVEQSFVMNYKGTFRIPTPVNFVWLYMCYFSATPMQQVIVKSLFMVLIIYCLLRLLDL